MSRQWWTITPDYSERFVANVLYPMLFPERRVKCGLWTYFPGTLPVNNYASAPANQEQNFFGCIMDVVRDHAPNLGDVHPH